MKLLKSFSFALNGLKICFTAEWNFKVHLVASAIVIVLAMVFNAGFIEWVVLVFAMALVIAMEMMNTAIEKLCDLVEPGNHPVIKQIKDISAGAVLVTAVCSAITGAIIFLPLIYRCIKNM